MSAPLSSPACILLPQLHFFPSCVAVLQTWAMLSTPCKVRSRIYSRRMLWPVWLSWLEHCPISWKVAGSIPSQGTCLSCGFSLRSGCFQEATDRCFLWYQCFSPSHSLPCPVSKKKINEHVLRWGLKKKCTQREVIDLSLLFFFAPSSTNTKHLSLREIAWAGATATRRGDGLLGCAPRPYSLVDAGASVS